MGQLFTRVPTERSDLQAPSIITSNNTSNSMERIVTKRKYIDEDIISKKRKLYSDNNLTRLILASKLSKSKFSNTSLMKSSLLPMTIFKCQLCCRCCTSKESYLDHMIICAIEHQASIKIVRAKKMIKFSNEK